MPIITLASAFAYLCGIGGPPLFSMERGKGDEEEAARVMGTCFSLLICMGLALTVAGLLLRRPMLYLFGASDDTFPYANEYMTVYLCGTLFVMISLGMNPFINSQGFGKIGMMTVFLGAAANIILDPIFIFAMDMGVTGAALATVIAQGLSAIWVMKFLTGPKAILRLKLSCLRMEAERCKKIIALGLSGFFQNMTNSLVQVVCNATLQSYGGDLYVTIMTILNSIREVVVMPIHGLTSGSQPVAGYNFGARKYGRVRESVRFSVSTTVIYSAATAVVCILLPEPLIRIFNDNPEVIAHGVPAMRIYFSMFAIFALQMSGQAVFVALGYSKRAIFFALLRKAFINAPLTVILPIWMGVTGVFTAEAISQLLGGFASFTTMYFTVYRKMGKLNDGELMPGHHV